MASIYVSATGNPSQVYKYLIRDGKACSSYKLSSTQCLISVNTLKSLYVFFDSRMRPTEDVTNYVIGVFFTFFTFYDLKMSLKCTPQPALVVWLMPYKLLWMSPYFNISTFFALGGNGILYSYLTKYCLVSLLALILMIISWWETSLLFTFSKAFLSHAISSTRIKNILTWTIIIIIMSKGEF